MLWRMKRTNIYLEERQTAILDRMASEQGVSRAEIVRRLLDEALHEQGENVAAGVAAIRESFGVLRDAEFNPTDRGEDARSRHLARVWNSDS